MSGKLLLGKKLPRKQKLYLKDFSLAWRGKRQNSDILELCDRKSRNRRNTHNHCLSP